jgi:hypothetical protein
MLMPPHDLADEGRAVAFQAENWYSVNMPTHRCRVTQDPASWQAGYDAAMSDDSPKRLQCPPEVPDAFAYASGYIDGQAARRRGATAKAEQPSPQAIRARKVTEQLIAGLWNGHGTEDHACVRPPRGEADPEA